MITFLFILSMFDLTTSSLYYDIFDPLEPPIFMLNCTADGPVQTINVMMSITEEIEFALQNTEIHINCSNGYHANIRDPDNFEAEFPIPLDEIYCTTKVTYYDYFNNGAATFSYKDCEFAVRAPTVSVGTIGSEIAGNSASLECNVTAVRVKNGSVDIIWMKESREVLKEHNKEGYSVNNTGFLMYRSYYNITMLQIIDNGTTYHCQAMINANPSVNDSSSFTLNVLDPTPNVTITALNVQIFDNVLSLRCDVTTEVGIGSSVNIVWIKDNTEILRENDIKGEPINNATAMLYISHYYSNITSLKKTSAYFCQAVIDTNPVVNNSAIYILNISVPAPNVTIAALNSQIINGSLLLRCDVTTVVGIGRSVDIVWMKEDGEILRENDTKGEPISNASLMLYTSYYFNNITTLQMINDNDVYYCQAIINTNPLVTNSDNYTLNVIDPTPNVTITALNVQIFDNVLSLRCDVTTEVGIGSSVNIVWIKDNTEILKENDIKGKPINNATAMLYISHYYSNVTSLKKTSAYFCQAVIDTNPVVNNSAIYTLNISGSDTTKNTDYHQRVLTGLGIVLGIVILVIIVLLILGCFLWKNGSKYLFAKEIINSQNKHMDLFDMDNADYSVIGRDKASTCEYLGNNSQKGVDNQKLYKHKLEECDSSLTSECKEEILNSIHSLSEPDITTNNVVSDLECCNKDDNFHVLGRIVEGREDGTQVTTPHSNINDNENHTALVSRQDESLSELHEYITHEKSVANSSTSPTSRSTDLSFTSSYVKIIPGLDTMNNQIDDSTTYCSEQLMDETLCTTPSTSNGDYVPYSTAINHPSLPSMVTKGDCTDYHVSVAQHPTTSNFQIAKNSRSMHHASLQGLKVDDFCNSNDKANAMTSAQSIHINQEFGKPINSSTDSKVEGGQYVDYDTSICMNK